MQKSASAGQEVFNEWKQCGPGFFSNSVVVAIQNAVTDIFRILANLGRISEILSQNLTEFNTRSRKFNSEDFQAYNLGCVKFC